MAKPADQQPSDPTIELSDSQLVPVSSPKAIAARAAAKAQQDVSLWRGEVVASSDFAPAPARRGVRLWLLLLLFGMIGVAGGMVALKIIKDPDPDPDPDPVQTPVPVVTPPAVAPTPTPVTPTPPPPVVTPPVVTPPTPTPPPVVEKKPPAVKSAVTPTKKIVKKKKKKPIKKRVTKKKSSSK